MTQPSSCSAWDEERAAGPFRRSLARNASNARTMRLFREVILEHYRLCGRRLPWRETKNPYRIVVSEIMLQQTGVDRVLPKYREFLRAFPTWRSLAAAGRRDVLALWQGLGYNRRALALKAIAEKVSAGFGGRLPSAEGELLGLPGIGAYTASALSAFIHNRPAVFIETNIRRVFIHFFFSDRTGVSDAEILPLVGAALDREDPRRWYYALMDYGSVLKQGRVNPNRKSLHYQKQSPFEGSNRQLRGRILKLLLATGPLTLERIGAVLGADPTAVSRNVLAMENEAFLLRRGMKVDVRT